MADIYCVLKHRIVWSRTTDAPTSITTNLLSVFDSFDDARHFAKEDIDKEERRLSKINNTRGVDRKSDNLVCCGFGYDDVEYNTEIQIRTLQ